MALLERKLSSYPSTLEEDVAVLEKLERFLEEPARPSPSPSGSGEGEGVSELRRAMRRRACALRVSVEDKEVLQQTLETVRAWIRRVDDGPEFPQ